MNIFSLTTNKLVEHLKTGQISSVEVCTRYIERIEKFEKDINAWEYFDKKKTFRKSRRSG
jgi:Asp-tRNA(Asn)/Glu-tRNA(Gln) amidotransferase A subunit family amidase